MHAFQSRKNGMSQLEEVLANLDVNATEFRLGRAKDDVHIAQSYMTCYVTEYMQIEWHAKKELIMDIQHGMMEVMDGIDRTHAR